MATGSDQGSMKDRIVAEARAELAAHGPAQLSFAAVARRLGVSKQAVIYWYPTKADLLSDVILPDLQAEAEALITAIGAHRGPAAVSAFVEAAVAFHLSDLDRFRAMYLVPQAGATARAEASPFLPRVHGITTPIYEVLADALGVGGRSDPTLRAEALALHSACLGIALMAALADSLGDPLKTPPGALAAALLARLA